MMITRFALVVLLLGTFGCSATYIRATVADNPLDRVAQNAQTDWSIERVDANTLHLSNAWVGYGLMMLGYSASHANLAYDPTDAVLYIQYYLTTYSPVYLFIPITMDAELGGIDDDTDWPDWRKRRRDVWSPKPSMNEEINDILRWSGAYMETRLADWISKFPARRPIPSPP
jgi:hypothetical protein